MKKNITLLMSILFVGLFTFSSCSKDDDPSTGGTTAKTEAISFKLNGSDFSVGTFNQDLDEISNFIELTANGSDQVTVLSLFLDVNGDGNLDVTDPLEASVTLQIGGNLYVGKSGSVIITSNDKAARTMEGTFSFVTTDNAQTPTDFTISEGKFYAKY
ncbi:MAG: hypothetical protein EP332_06560 [Bacteroidetes bacterium]|nr:MAG: hypothetical protein EP332_06560 [Bacteroidota bacterium]